MCNEPATLRQSLYIDRLLLALGWDHERFDAFLAERNMQRLTMTKQQAARIIDLLKAIDHGFVPR